MLLSLANALLLFFTMTWSFMGIVELRILIKSYKKIKTGFESGSIDKVEFFNKTRSYKFCFIVNISYLFIILCQLVYVILNWDEVNI